jgi:ABC-type nitrate/sulfonate/bicarbonate transport system ATPase subunit
MALACNSVTQAQHDLDRERVTSMSKIELHGVSRSFRQPDGTEAMALAPVSLAIESGRFVSLIGPSGCGKTTIFNIVAGLLEPSSGRVMIDGEEATGTIGRVGYMLQKDLLFPWRTVLDNVVLGMEIQGMKMAEARAHALPLLQRYGLGGYEAHYPSALSGGMRQRAALLRTLLFDCDTVLLDEPFGALDAQTKSRMQEWLLQIWADFRKTVIFVTHDIEEALYLSDEVYVMSPRPGRITAHFDVDFARPRPRSVIAEPDFTALKQRCLALLDQHDTAPSAARAA